MKVVITGGTGFIGQRLACKLLERGSLTGPNGQQAKIDDILLFDQGEPAQLAEPLKNASNVSKVFGDISDRATVDKLFDRPDISVFHLASVVSGGGEKDFDLAMRVNLDGGLHIWDNMRRIGEKADGLPRLVFASSVAVFGGQVMPQYVGDDTKQTAQTTYGITKTIGELLINDYSRKGYFDGRAARLPTVIVRPGKPNAAASSFVSGIIREPLNGVDMDLPVELETVMPVLGYRSIVDGFIHLHEIDAAKLGDDRAVGLPALNVSMAEMKEALERVADGRKLGKITVKPDPFIQDIVAGWASHCDNTRADKLGFPIEAAIDDIITAYMADYL